MRVLGLDPGTRTTGWGLLLATESGLRAAYGCLHPPRNATRAVMLARLAADLEVLLADHRPDAVAIETPFISRFPRAALGLAEVRGALLAALGRWGGEVVEYEPARVKSAVVGFGRAEKQQVAYVMRHELRLIETPPTDAADALALALCHVRGLVPTAGAVRTCRATEA